MWVGPSGRSQAGGRGLHGAGVEPAVRVRRLGLSGAGPEAGRGFGQGVRSPGVAGAGGRAEPGVPPGGKNLRARGSRLSAPIGAAAPGTSGPNRACFRSIWRRPAESGAGESIFGSGGDTRLG